MGIGQVSRHQLDAFVDACDARGGPESAESAVYLSDFSYALEARVDQTLDPFSDAYVEQQLAVYREIAGRDLDQVSFEQAPVDVDRCVTGGNPYGIDDPGFIAPHALAVIQALWLAGLPPGASVLDMGCGWGLSTELIGFCGASVTCVDINPRFLALVEERARRRGLRVRTVLSAFDSLTLPDDEQHDLALFYESLHHAVRPWEVLERIAPHVRGKIMISGEPIQKKWWKSWGLRLDPVSVYCMHKHGWFESGFSKPFITACFARAGFHLTLLRGLSLGTGYLGVATRSGAERYDAARIIGGATLALQIVRGVRREMKAPAGVLSRIRNRLR